MSPPGKWWKDLVTFRHGYDLHLVVSLGVGLSWTFQDAVRTRVPAYALLNSGLGFLPFHPMRLMGGVLVALGLLAYAGCRRGGRLGFYGILGQTLFWFTMVLVTWWGAFSHHAGFSGPVIYFALAMGGVQYLRVYEVRLESQERAVSAAER